LIYFNTSSEGVMFVSEIARGGGCGLLNMSSDASLTATCKHAVHATQYAYDKLLTHDACGDLICHAATGKDLPASIVEEAFQYASGQHVPLVAFLGDDCVTLRMTNELQVCARPSVAQFSIPFALNPAWGLLRPQAMSSCCILAPDAGTKLPAASCHPVRLLRKV
jgi:hypothetical protein